MRPGADPAAHEGEAVMAGQQLPEDLLRRLIGVDAGEVEPQPVAPADERPQGDGLVADHLALHLGAVGDDVADRDPVRADLPG